MHKPRVRRTQYERQAGPLFSLVNAPERFRRRHGLESLPRFWGLYQRVWYALLGRCKERVETRTTRIRISGLTGDYVRLALPVIDQWWRQRERVVFDIVPGWEARVLRRNPRGVLELEWAGEDDTIDLERLLGRDLARVQIEHMKTHVRRGKIPQVVVREPRRWLAYLRAFSPGERAALRTVLGWLQRSRDWQWSVCDYCKRRFTISVGDIKDCYPCRRREPPWKRSRTRNKSRSRRATSVLRDLRVIGRGDLTKFLGPEVPIRTGRSARDRSG